jgi:hypothetical protein
MRQIVIENYGMNFVKKRLMHTIRIGTNSMIGFNHKEQNHSNIGEDSVIPRLILIYTFVLKNWTIRTSDRNQKNGLISIA